MLSLIQWVLGLGLLGLGIGIVFTVGWALIGGLVLLGFLPMLLVVNLFLGRR